MQPADRVSERFVLGRRAGSGGMGEVFQAVDAATGETVAVKVLRNAAAQDRVRFAREVEILAGLSHPAIVRYLGHGITELDEPYLVMEWLDGEDLSARLRRSCLDLDEAVTLARRVAEALAEAHGQGVVHRDLKPGNLFLVGGEVAQVKLLDFGVARLGVRSRITETGASVGTPGYMAPELARGDDNPTPAVDVFALGCVLYEALSGKPAFHGHDMVAVLAKLILDEPPRLDDARPDVPAALAALVTRMLAKDCGGRPPDGAAVLAALDAVAWQAAPGAPSPPSVSRRPLGGVERRVVQVVLIGSGGVDAAAGDPSAVTLAPCGLPAAELDRVEELAAQAGARIARLADGSAAIPLTGGGAAEDRAAIAARLALALRVILPDRALALATGWDDTTGRMELGDAIDRASRRLSEITRAAEALSEIARPAEALADEAPPPGGRAPLPIAIDEATAALLGARFDWDDGAAGLVLRGEREGALADMGRTLLGKATPCVGRERELRQLEDLLSSCVEEQRACAVLVTAPAGMGKSRLAHELIAAQRRRGAPLDVLVGRGDPMRAGSSLAMLAQVIGAACGVRGGEPLEERRQRICAWIERRVPPGPPPDERALLAELLGEITGAPFPDDASPRLRAARRDARLMAEEMQRAFVALVRAACAARPVLIVLEDMQWGDASTARFVDAALRECGDRPLMALALARPEVHEAFPRLWIDRGAQEIRLRPLSPRASERLVRAALGDAVDDRIAARLVAQADGHAFYLEELIRAASEGRAELPETVAAMVQARLDGVEPEARRVLRIASVFGDVFWKGGVTSMLGGGARADMARAWLSRLVEREILVRRRESRFPGEEELAFRHTLLREGSYATLTDEDRSLAHRLAGRWLEARGETDALVLAEHFELGGELERAATYYLAAAEGAKKSADLDAVLRHARRGVSCGATGDTKDVLLGLLCEVHVWRNELTPAIPYMEEVLRIAPPGSVPWLQGAFIKMYLALALQQDPVATLVALRDRLRGVTPPVEAVGLLCLFLSGSVLLLDVILQRDLAEELMAQLAALEGQLAGSPIVRAWVASSRGLHDAVACDDPWIGFQQAQVAAALFEEMGDRWYALCCQVLVWVHRWYLGAADQAERPLRECVEAQIEVGLISTYPAVCLSAVLAERGAFDEARRAAARLIDAGRAQGQPLTECRGRAALAYVLLRAGESDAAGREASAALDLIATTPVDEPGVLATRAAARRAEGRLDEALADAERAAAQLEARRACGFFRGAFVRLVHAECLASAGRSSEARAALAIARARLLAIAATIDDPAYRRSFLEGVPENARTLQLAREWLGEPPPGA